LSSHVYIDLLQQVIVLNFNDDARQTDSYAVNREYRVFGFTGMMGGGAINNSFFLKFIEWKLHKF